MWDGGCREQQPPRGCCCCLLPRHSQVDSPPRWCSPATHLAGSALGTRGPKTAVRVVSAARHPTWSSRASRRPVLAVAGSERGSRVSTGPSSASYSRCTRETSLIASMPQKTTARSSRCRKASQGYGWSGRASSGRSARRRHSMADCLPGTHSSLGARMRQTRGLASVAAVVHLTTVIHENTVLPHLCRCDILIVLSNRVLSARRRWRKRSFFAECNR